MRFAEPAGVVVVAWLLAALTGCGGGTSSETTVIGGGIAGGTGAASASVDVPTGPNTTEIVVDSGPASGFSLGAANIPYVTITVCTPGSTTDCTTIDHVFLDTGSIGLRVLKSAVAKLTLPAVAVPFNAVAGTVAGKAAECYPFVLGAVWGTIASADLRIAGELAASIPIQLIDDASPATIQVPADCIAAADGGLQNSVSSLQANGILGVGMLAYDCGLACINGDYSSGHTLYYSCPPQAASPCTPAAVPGSRQVQNPVVHFAVNNNGTLIALPPLPDLGAQTAKGRLVFGIGTQANNQIAPSVKMYFVDADPASANYLYLSTSVGAVTYAQSYVDSGSNAYFFDDPSMPHGCQSTTGTIAGWYCPTALQHRTATIRDARGATGQVDFAVANADALFSTSSLAFADLAGSVGAGGHSFTWGLPFFFGRTVYTSIWGQALSTTGPWNAF
jgi:hypothetical protein